MSAPLLDSISIEGFKSIASIKALVLRPINVVIGPNGSGKSNLIGVFSFLHTIREGRLQDYVRTAGGAEQLLHFGSKQTKRIRIDISFKGGVNQYKLALKSNAEDSLFPSLEIASFWNQKNHPDPKDDYLPARMNGLEAGISDPNLTTTSIAGWVRACLGSWRLFHVHDTSTSSPLRKTAQINDNRFLRPDGSNLPAFLYLLSKNHADTYHLIRNTVQRVAPFFDDFQLEPDRLNPDTIRLAWKHRNSNQYFGAATLSDGTLRFIALTALLLQPLQYRPSVILVDEPELGLHPYAITLLASLIKQAATETQVIVSTQSPLLLDHFQPEDVIVANRINDGTTLERLDTARLSGWLEDYSLGQLWEKNEFGGRPGSVAA